MSTGTAANGVCYATQLEAAQMWCSTVNASTSVGLMTCRGIGLEPSPTVGGVLSFTWKRRTVDGTGASSQSDITNQMLLACETYDYAYWSPYISAFISAMVLILCARWTIRYIKADRDTV